MPSPDTKLKMNTSLIISGWKFLSAAPVNTMWPLYITKVILHSHYVGQTVNTRSQLVVLCEISGVSISQTWWKEVKVSFKAKHKTEHHLVFTLHFIRILRISFFYMPCTPTQVITLLGYYKLLLLILTTQLLIKVNHSHTRRSFQEKFGVWYLAQGRFDLQTQ